MPATPILAPGPAADTAARSVAASRRSDWIGAGVALLGSALLFLLSNSVQYGDAATYAKEIRAGRLIEPGHLAWRPLGHLAVSLTGLLHSDSEVLWVLQWLSLLFSALSVAALWLFLRRRAGCGPVGAGAAAALLAVSNGFWGYSFSGCSYSLSVLLVIAAMGCTCCPERPVSAVRALLAGALAGAAASSWAIQVLALPGLFLLLVLTPPWERALWPVHLRNACAMAGGWILTFLLPLLAAYAWQAHHPQSQADTPPRVFAGFGQWLASSNHGIAPQLSLAQSLRVVIGWPQSILSSHELGQGLRLWRLHEHSFPWSAWMLTPLIVYALTAFCAWRLLRSFRGGSQFERGLIIASAVAIGANLLFGALWTGTALERYFPSLPFQLLLLALALKPLSDVRRATAMIVITLCFLAWTNWYAAYLTVFSSHTYRQVWLRELRRVATGRDLVIVLGQNIFVVTAPHDPQMPRIDNLAIEIPSHGADWETGVRNDIEAAVQGGGRVFLGDSLFDSTTARRNGWSFKEVPSPSPQEIKNAFLPLKSDTVAFTADGEQVWLAR